MRRSGSPLRRRLNPLDGADRLRIAEGGNNRVEVREVVHFDVEMERLEAAVAVDQLKVDDVGVLGAKDAGHGAKRAGDIAQDDRQPSRAAVRALAPGEIEPVSVDPAR